jgi:nucleotide-binding universal stress UspA family protein
LCESWSEQINGVEPLYQHILVGTDGSVTAARAVQHAIGLAKCHQAHLHVVSVNKDITVLATAAGVPSGAELVSSGLNEDANELLSGVVEEAKQAGVEATAHVLKGQPSEEICKLAGNLDVDLIVIGNRGMQSLIRFLWDPIPDTISHHAPCSVLIVDTRPKN